MKIYPFPAVVPNLDKVPHSNDFFDTVKFRYHEYAQEGLFQALPTEGLFIYQIKNTEGNKYTGIIACTDIQEYYNGTIKKHEKTIAQNELLQAELLLIRRAAIKPVLLTYARIDALDALIEDYIDTHKKLYVIELASEKHRFWHVTEGGVIAAIQAIFEENMPVAYIADGHHRSASFALMHEKRQDAITSKMLCAYFNTEQIEIDTFYRVITDLNGLSSDVFLDKLTPLFKIKVLKKAVKPYAKHEITMYLDGKWFQLNWRKSELKGFAEGKVLLDVHLLNEKVLKPVLEVKNIRTDSRVRYIEGNKSLESLENITPTEGVAFCLFPVEFDDLKAVADSNGAMPPKSTFCQPRMKNGLVVYEI